LFDGGRDGRILNLRPVPNQAAFIRACYSSPALKAGAQKDDGVQLNQGFPERLARAPIFLT
jgi:hypothetical protein